MIDDIQLRKNMTADGYVRIEHLLTLPLIVPLAKNNKQMIIKAIEKSKMLKLGYDENANAMAKYSLPMERKTLILRDMPIGSSVADISAIFDNPNCAKPIDIRHEIGNNWFVTFDTEDDNLTTMQYLQQQNIGLPLEMRVNAESYIQPSAEYFYDGYNYDSYYPPLPMPPLPYMEDMFNEPLMPTIIDPPSVENDISNYCDYPGPFEKYEYQTFVDIFNSMKIEQLSIPQSMKGRDARIVSESVLLPSLYLPLNEKQNTNQRIGRGRGGWKHGRNRKHFHGQPPHLSNEKYMESGVFYYDDGYVDEYEPQQAYEYLDNNYYDDVQPYYNYNQMERNDDYGGYGHQRRKRDYGRNRRNENRPQNHGRQDVRDNEQFKNRNRVQQRSSNRYYPRHKSDRR